MFVRSVMKYQETNLLTKMLLIKNVPICWDVMSYDKIYAFSYNGVQMKISVT